MANHYSIQPSKIMEMSSKSLTTNSVKENTQTRESTLSLGRDSHEQWVGPDRHQVTTQKKSNTNVRKKFLRVGTWNVRTLYQAGKLDNLVKEMERLKVNVFGISETRWTDTGVFTSGDCTMISSGSTTHERGVAVLLDKATSRSLIGYWCVSDRVMLVKLAVKPFNLAIVQVYAPTADSDESDITAFYEDLGKAMKQCKSDEITMVIGDLNAKVGEGRDGDTVGPHGLGVRNERGDQWIEWCNGQDLMVANTWFMQPARRKYTWKSPGDRTRNQIDYITIKKRFRNAVKETKTYPGADIGSDHVPVICRIQVKLKCIKKQARAKKLDYAKLKEDSNIKDQYSLKVTNRFEVLEDEGDKDKWQIFQEAIVEPAREVIPPKKKKTKNSWMTEDILDLMEERRQHKGKNEDKYKELDDMVRRKCLDAKEVWMNNMCDEIEQQRHRDSKEMHRNIKELCGKKVCSSGGCIKSKDGDIIIEKDQILKRWTEYITELFEDDRGNLPTINREIDGPDILQAEVQAAVRSMKSNKATGPDEISAELIQSLGELGITKLTEVLNEIYNTGVIPPELTKSIFIVLPKKPGATLCGLHRTISIMSHVVKILLKILMKRARNKIRPEIPKTQCGFVEDCGTRNAIFMLRMLSERAIEMKQDLYLCFIDYTKAFDTVKHGKLFSILCNLNLDGKDLRIIRNLYWNQTAAVRVGDDVGEYVDIKKGVRQGCVFSPDLFNLYSEWILRELEELPGVVIGGTRINNLRYADDAVLIATSEADLQLIMDKVVTESEKKGLFINCKKTECLVISKQKNVPDCNIKIHGANLKQVNGFNYLGSWITSDGKCVKEIQRRITLAKDTFSRMSTLLCNMKITMSTRLRILDCYVLPILKYGCESWLISKEMESRLHAAEMWFLRRMMRIPWTSHTTNKAVLERADRNQRLVKTIRKQQLEFLGHCVRKNDLEYLFLTGKIEGKRDRGRQRATYLQNVAAWVNMDSIALLRLARNRKKWHSMIAKVMRYGT